MRRATKKIVIIGWSIDSQLLLKRSHKGEGEETDRLLPFLNSLLDQQPDLSVYILCWDYSLIYTMEREKMQSLRVAFKAHERLQFEYDANHPVAASHHQKIISIDDQVAFVGGIDLTRYRWDTAEHHLDDERRTNVNGEAFQPFHDLGVMASGEWANQVAELCDLRWKNATGKELVTASTTSTPWPEQLTPHLSDFKAGLPLTLPRYGRFSQRRDTEQVLKKMLSAAKKYIYIENQYFAADFLPEILAEKLQQPDGPEIIVLLPVRYEGVFELATMGVKTSRYIAELRTKDKNNRLHFFTPFVKKQSIMVHAKLALVDDQYLYLGSANLNQRSMRLDTECGFYVEGSGKKIKDFIQYFRQQLLANHLGCNATDLRQGPESLFEQITRNQGNQNSLHEFTSDEKVRFLDDILPDGASLEIEESISLKEKLKKMFSQ